MVLPASIFLAAAALRLLQPRQYEPARTSWALFDWTTTHISSLGASVLFVGVPALAFVVGCAALLLSWRQDDAFRNDAIVWLTIIRRHLAVAIVATSSLLAAAILTFAVAHMIVG